MTDEKREALIDRLMALNTDIVDLDNGKPVFVIHGLSTVLARREDEADPTVLRIVAETGYKLQAIP